MRIVSARPVAIVRTVQAKLDSKQFRRLRQCILPLLAAAATRKFRLRLSTATCSAEGCRMVACVAQRQFQTVCIMFQSLVQQSLF